MESLDINNKIKKTLIIGDLHLGISLSYSDICIDRRIPEKKEILNFIIKQAEDCSEVIILGDIFTNYNAPSSVIKDFTEFLEKFGNKQVYILSGNHDSKSDGSFTGDYLKEIKGKNWTVISAGIQTIDDMTFLPYLTNALLEVSSNEEAKEKVMSMLKPNKFLFLHHSVSNIFINSTTNTNDLPELVLPQEELSKLFSLIILGHIHQSSTIKNIIVAGSIFPYSINEEQKFIWKLDKKTMKIDKIALPGRKILSVTDPTQKEIEELKDNSIIKVILTKKLTTIKLDTLRKSLEDKFSETGGFMIIDQTKVIRDRDDYKESVTEMSIDKLLGIYAEQKEVDLDKLKLGFELIRTL